MDFRRFWIALLCLPALIAPSGLSWVLCLCGNLTPSAPGESCCAKVEERSCCELSEKSREAPVNVHAPCPSCLDLHTPDTSTTRTQNGGDELGHMSLLPLPKSFTIALTVQDPRDAAARPRAPHAPPRAAPLPLRI
jgi:hypothetical protein